MTAPYRERADLPEVVTHPPGFRRGPSTVASIALGGAAGILVAGGMDLAALASLGMLAMSAQGLVSLRARYRQGWLLRFLGSEGVVVEPARWTSRDGRRRLRAAPDDELLRFEYLDGDRTVLSVRGASPLGPEPVGRSSGSVLAVAKLHGRALRPRCFRGRPEVLGGRPVAVRAHAVGLRATDEGVLAVRVDACGWVLGDTLHPDRFDAQTALEEEYGAHLGRWRASLEADHPEKAWGDASRSELGL